MPADSSGAYSFAVTVWWTKASWTSPYSAGARGGTLSAPQALRGMIAGGPAAWAARPRDRRLRRVASRAVGWARTKRPRSARGAPRRRSWNSSAAPVNAGSVPVGSGPRSGPWSPAGCSCHPARPAAAAAAGAQLGVGLRAARPVQADEVEAARRAQHRRGLPAAGGPRGAPAPEHAVEVELEDEVVAVRQRRQGGAQADDRGGGRAGLQSLPAGERTTGHEQLEHGDRWKGPHRCCCERYRAAQSGHEPRSTMSCPPTR